MLFNISPKKSIQHWISFTVICVIFLFNSCSNHKEKTFAFADLPSEETYSVIVGGINVGHLNVSHVADTIITDYDYKNNGRGPTIADTILVNTEGFPIQWKINGSTTFGNVVEEYFEQDGNMAYWTDATGPDSAAISKPTFYIDQNGSPYSLFLLARILLAAPDSSITALPSGALKLTEMDTLSVGADSAKTHLKTFALTGIDITPTYFALDENNRFFCTISSWSILIRKGYEDVVDEMIHLSEQYAADLYISIQKKYAHQFNKNIRIQNVKIFDPTILALTDPVSVLVSGDRILSIDSPEKISKNEVIIDGNGGTLVPGLFDMHAHMGIDQALLNVLAGVTSVRDMGNHNEVLDSLIHNIETGILVGPRITRMGFIEGESPFSANNGILVNSQEEALDAVSTYSDKGYYGIKIYNSMNGDWVPAIVEKAHALNMPVMGHVPAFSTANEMIRAGYDEMTHINQVMLGWVLKPGEDTRSLLRFTAMKRFPYLDLNNDPKVKETLDLMVKNKVAMDPTLAIHEALLLARNGSTWPGTVDFVKHMPVNVQRSYKVAWASIADEKEDQEYQEAFDKIVETLALMKKRGILIVPGTDLGGEFFLHRELELYQKLGYSPAELLKLGSYDMAQYLGKKDLGTIEPGMLADFFLVPGDPTKDFKAIKTISLVSRGGTLYFPSEIYPEFGIKPFTKVPDVDN